MINEFDCKCMHLNVNIDSGSDRNDATCIAWIQSIETH